MFENDKNDANYKTLYLYLFNGITDIINMMETEPFAKCVSDYIFRLKLLQINSEEMYIQQGEDTD